MKTKCPKTTSGKHIWREQKYELVRSEAIGGGEYAETWSHINECVACGLMDDLHIK